MPKTVRDCIGHHPGPLAALVTAALANPKYQPKRIPRPQSNPDHALFFSTQFVRSLSHAPKQVWPAQRLHQASLPPCFHQHMPLMRSSRPCAVTHPLSKNKAPVFSSPSTSGGPHATYPNSQARTLREPPTCVPSQSSPNCHSRSAICRGSPTATQQAHKLYNRPDCTTGNR